MATTTGRYALRSMRRNARRTALSIAGIAIGCVLALFMESLNRGKGELLARAGASAGIGHLRIVPGEWPGRRDPRLRLADWQHDAAAARSLRGARTVTTRTRAQVLLAMGTHVAPVELVGVEPAVEPETFRYVRHMTSGRYLSADDTGALVLGKAVADRLDAAVEDDIVATAVGPRGEIESAMLRIVGIVATGSEDADGSVCQAVRADVERLTGLPGAGEVTVVLDDYRTLDAARAALAGRLAPGDTALTLVQLAPEVEGHFEQDTAASRVISGIILLIVLLGVASAQLAAVLERRREFAVLSALGMSAGAMGRLIVQEAVLLGIAGGGAGLAAGLPLVWWLAGRGLDFSRYLGDSYSFQGVLIDPVMRGDLGWWIVPYVLIVALGATIVASVYPAWFASRTDPAAALRVAQ